MSTFPSVLTSYTNPLPTNPLNAPSHSGIETAQNGGLSQIEAVIGLANGSSTLGTIIGDLRSPASNGGGHVQSANAGGTGQTSFNKGDILVASSSSVLSKVAVGADNTVLKADSTQTSGVSWSTVVASKVLVKTSIVSISGGISSVANVLFSASVAGSVLGTNNAIRFKGVIDSFTGQASGGNTLTVNVQYGNQSVAGIQVTAVSSVMNIGGTVEGMIAGNGSSGSQKGFMSLNLGGNEFINSSSSNSQVVRGFSTGTTSVASGASQDLIVTYSQTGANGQAASPSILASIFVVDKIV